MQTKYTAFLVPAVMVLYSLIETILRPRPRPSLCQTLTPGPLASVVATLVFVAWESFVASRYGVSHFLYHFRDNQIRLIDKIAFALPLPVLLGGVAPAVFLLALCVLKPKGKIVGVAGGYSLLTYLLIGLCPSQWVAELPLREALRFRILERSMFFVLGLGLFVALGFVAARLLRLPHGGLTNRPLLARHRLDWFLVSWLLLEVAGYFALSPFLGVRRVMGIVVVATLLAGRLASRTCRTPGQRRLVTAIAIGNVTLALFFYAVDLRKAQGTAKSWKRRRSSYIRPSRKHASGTSATGVFNITPSVPA